MKALIIALPILLVFLSGYAVGRYPLWRDDRKQEKRIEVALKANLRLAARIASIQHLAALHAATEPFAVIVLDELNKKEEE